MEAVLVNLTKMNHEDVLQQRIKSLFCQIGDKNKFGDGLSNNLARSEEVIPSFNVILIQF